MMTGWEQCFYPLSASPITAVSLEVRGAKAPLPDRQDSSHIWGPEAVGPPHPDVAREEVPAPSKTASVMGREGGGWSLGPHTLRTGGCSGDGGGSADLLAKMILYIVDLWGWEMARREFWRAGVEAGV